MWERSLSSSPIWKLLFSGWDEGEGTAPRGVFASQRAGHTQFIVLGHVHGLEESVLIDAVFVQVGIKVDQLEDVHRLFADMIFGADVVSTLWAFEFQTFEGRDQCVTRGIAIGLLE